MSAPDCSQPPACSPHRTHRHARAADGPRRLPPRWAKPRTDPCSRLPPHPPPAAAADSPSKPTVEDTPLAEKTESVCGEAGTLRQHESPGSGRVTAGASDPSGCDLVSNASTPGIPNRPASSSSHRSARTGWLSPSAYPHAGSTRSSMASAASVPTPHSAWPATSAPATGSGSTSRSATTSRSRRTTSGAPWIGSSRSSLPSEHPPQTRQPEASGRLTTEPRRSGVTLQAPERPPGRHPRLCICCAGAEPGKLDSGSRLVKVCWTMVELRGFEPLTSSLRTRRATNCAIAPSSGAGTKAITSAGRLVTPGPARGSRRPTRWRTLNQRPPPDPPPPWATRARSARHGPPSPGDAWEPRPVGKDRWCARSAASAAGSHRSVR